MVTHGKGGLWPPRLSLLYPDHPLYLHELPLPFLEIIVSRQSYKGFCYWYGQESPKRSHVKSFGQQISKWYLEEPEADKIDPGWGAGIASAIERLYHAHANTIKNISATYYLQGKCSIPVNFRVTCKNADIWIWCYWYG